MSSEVLTRSSAHRLSDAPMDPRLRARRVEVARNLGRRRLKRLLALGAATVAIIGTLALVRSPVLDVDQVRVTGSTRSDVGQLRKVAGIPLGRAMVSVNPAPAVARLEQLPWVSHAVVSRRWPGTVEVRITERRAVAVVGQGPGAVLVDRSGRILGPASGTDGLPLAGTKPTEDPGKFLPPERRRVVRLLVGLPPTLQAEVVRGTVGRTGLGLVLVDGITVHLGDATRLRAKAEAVGVLLAQADRATIAAIDVSVPGSGSLTRSQDSKEGA